MSKKVLKTNDADEITIEEYSRKLTPFISEERKPIANKKFPVDFRVSKESANFLSYGRIAGNYLFDNMDVLTDFIIENNFSKEFAFIEVKTEFYRFMIDIDLKSDKHIILKSINNPIEVIDYVFYMFIGLFLFLVSMIILFFVSKNKIILLGFLFLVK